MIRKAALSAIGVIAAGILVGCSGATYQPLEIHSVSFIPNARIEKKLYGNAIGKSLALEGSGTWMKGSDSQELTAQPFFSSQAKVGGTTFAAPQTLNTSFNLSVYDSSLRWHSLRCALRTKATRLR